MFLYLLWRSNDQGLFYKYKNFFIDHRFRVATLVMCAKTNFCFLRRKITDVTYCTMDGEPQKMDIYFPDSGGPWPVLVYVHGGSWMVGDKSEAAGLGESMNAQGYAFVSLNYRLYPFVHFPR